MEAAAGRPRAQRAAGCTGSVVAAGTKGAVSHAAEAPRPDPRHGCRARADDGSALACAGQGHTHIGVCNHAAQVQQRAAAEGDGLRNMLAARPAHLWLD